MQSCWQILIIISVIGAVLAQDIATHGYFTEPNTGIVFYTSSEANGTIVGDGEFSTVSWGGYTWGIALPENALTVDSYEYLGLIVSWANTCNDIMGRILNI